MSRDPLPPVLVGELRALGFPLFLVPHLQSLRQAGQRHRLPYWTAFIAEAEDAVVLNAFKRGDSA
jgi:hypothetical protein